MRRRSCTDLAKRLKSLPLAQVAAMERTPEKKPNSPKKGVIDKQKEDDEKKLRKVYKHLHKIPRDELEMILYSEDNFLIDCVLDQVQDIKELQNERDDLQKQVKNLAFFNYSREGEFVRDRLQLRETINEAESLRHRLNSKASRALLILNKAEAELTKEAREHEERSERMAQDLLDRNKNYEEFMEEYVELRKETHIKRILADKIAKNNKMMANDLSPLGTNSPIPAPRRRKRESVN